MASCLSIALSGSVMGEVWYEVPHLSHHSNEAGQLQFVNGRCHLGNALNLPRAGVHAIHAVLSSKERHFWPFKF